MKAPTPCWMVTRPSGAQLCDRLAHDGAADAELVDEFLLRGQLVANLAVAAGNPLGQYPRHLTGQVFPFVEGSSFKA